MTLYEVDLDKLAVPVKSMEEKKRKATKEPKPPKEVKEKKPRAKKVKVETVAVKTEEVSPVLDAPAETPSEAPVETPVEAAVEAPVETSVDTAAEEPPKKKIRAPRQKKDPTVPPQWFAKYVEGVKKEQATLKTEKVAPKQIKEEAKEAASKSWNNGLTRNRVENEVNGHMSRMYSMIFSK